jgi:cell division cycle protein 37
MVLSLLLQVSEASKKAVEEKKGGDGEEAMVKEVGDGLEKHLVQLGEHTENLKKELADEQKEQKKHITSEDMHDGFDSKVMLPIYRIPQSY